MTCRKLEKENAGDEWTLDKLAGIPTEDIWTWTKKDTTEYDGNEYLARDKCIDFERELWLELGKCMWRKYQSVYQDHMKYVCNDIVKPFKFKILCYAKRVRDMHDLAQYLPPPSMKNESDEADNWDVRNQ